MQILQSTINHFIMHSFESVYVVNSSKRRSGYANQHECHNIFLPIEIIRASVYYYMLQLLLSSYRRICFHSCKKVSLYMICVITSSNDTRRALVVSSFICHQRHFCCLDMDYTQVTQSSIQIIKISKYVFEGSCFAKIQLLMTNFLVENNIIFIII